MRAQTVPWPKTRGKLNGFPVLPFAMGAAVIIAAGGFVTYVLWPSWPTAPVALDAPAIPVTVAGVLFDVPPAAIRTAVQRHPGAHERIDLALLWPSLAPPEADHRPADKPIAKLDSDATPAPPGAGDRLFVTIAALGAMLPPVERLRTIYPHYIEAEATAGPDGLAVLPFRSGTPYHGEDLVYLGAQPEQFFARCTRPLGAVPGTCIHQRTLDAAEITLRFPREWLSDWRKVAAGFDRLLTQLHPPSG